MTSVVCLPCILLFRALCSSLSMEQIQPSGRAGNRSMSQPSAADIPSLIPVADDTSFRIAASLPDSWPAGQTRAPADGLFYRGDAAQLVGGGTQVEPSAMARAFLAAEAPAAGQGLAPLSAGGIVPSTGDVVLPGGGGSSNYDSILSWASDPRRRPALPHGVPVAAPEGLCTVPQEALPWPAGGQGAPLVANPRARLSSSTTGAPRLPSGPPMVLNFQRMGAHPADGSSSSLPSQTPAPPVTVGATAAMQHPGFMGAPSVAAVPPLSGAVPPLPPARLAPPPTRRGRGTQQQRSRSASPKRRAGNPACRGIAASAGPPPPATLDTLAITLVVGLKALDGKLNKLQSTVDCISSVASAEANKTNNLAVLAESMTAVQSATTSALAEFKDVTHAAAATLRDAPGVASTKSGNDK